MSGGKAYSICRDIDDHRPGGRRGREVSDSGGQGGSERGRGVGEGKLPAPGCVLGFFLPCLPLKRYSQYAHTARATSKLALLPTREQRRVHDKDCTQRKSCDGVIR